MRLEQQYWTALFGRFDLDSMVQGRFRDIDIVVSRTIFMIMKSKCTIVDKDISHFRGAVRLALVDIEQRRFREF